MTDNEIKKALECCKSSGACGGCVLKKEEYCINVLKNLTLDLINRLQAENERLKNAYKQCAYERDVFLRENPVEMALLIDEQAEQLKTANAEVERLQKENENFADMGKMFSEIKAEAYKECMEQLDAEIESSDKYIREYDDSELQKAYNKGLRNALKALKGLVGEQAILNDVKCKDCEYLELELPYAVCSKAYKGIVAPDDGCGKGKLKEMVGEDK